MSPKNPLVRPKNPGLTRSILILFGWDWNPTFLFDREGSGGLGRELVFGPPYSNGFSQAKSPKFDLTTRELQRFAYCLYRSPVTMQICG